MKTTKKWRKLFSAILLSYLISPEVFASDYTLYGTVRAAYNGSFSSYENFEKLNEAIYKLHAAVVPEYAKEKGLFGYVTKITKFGGLDKAIFDRLMAEISSYDWEKGDTFEATYGSDPVNMCEMTVKVYATDSSHYRFVCWKAVYTRL